MVLIRYAMELNNEHPNTTILRAMEDRVFLEISDLNIVHSIQMGMLIDYDIQLWHRANPKILLDGRMSNHRLYH